MPVNHFAHARKLLALNIRELRAIKGLAQEKLGFEAEVDRTLVSKIEREIANPTLEVLAKLCACLEIPLGRLFYAPEEETTLSGGGLRASLASLVIVNQYPPEIFGSFSVSFGV